MKKLLSITMLLFSTLIFAELPSWGMTENQYKLPNFNAKMKEIGSQAAKRNWLLKITAPKDWHNKIRSGLTDSGAMDVQVNFKDSLHQSITITAAPGIKMAKVTPSTTNTTVQKQVVIEKPEIDTEVDAPEFGDIEIKSNTDDLLEGLNDIEIAIPQANAKTTVQELKEEVKQVVTTTKPVEPPVQKPVKPVVQHASKPSTEATEPTIQHNEVMLEASKEKLRKRHARTKRVDKLLSYDSIKSKDDLFIDGSVVLIKRFINQGVVLYFWMKENYDPSIHKLVEKGSGKYRKDPTAVQGDEPGSAQKTSVEEKHLTNLDFIAVDTDIESQDDLRKDFARNKRVNVNIKADQLKEGDVLYALNHTVLVERRITRAQSAYFWLVGETAIPRKVERKDDNRFIVR